MIESLTYGPLTDEPIETEHEVACLKCDTVFARVYEAVPRALLVSPARVGGEDET